MNKINYKLINILLIIIIIYFLYNTKLLWFNIFNLLKEVITPFLISFVLSYTLYPLVKILNKKNINKTLSKIIVIVFILIFLFIIIYISIPKIITNLTSFSTFLINYQTRIELINNILLKLNNTITNFIYNNSFDLIKTSTNIISNLVIIIVLTIYFLFNMEAIINKIKSFLSKTSYFNVFKEIDYDLNKYIKSISIIFIIELLEYMFLFFIIGHPNYLLLGLLAGISTLIPYFGSLITNLIALVTSISISKRLFILTSLVALITPIFDNYIVDPKIYHKTIKISPLKSLSIMIISSSIFGFYGLLIAIPLYIILEKIIKELIVRRK